jgi:hypothetical protein
MKKELRIKLWTILAVVLGKLSESDSNKVKKLRPLPVAENDWQWHYAY